MSKPYRQHGPGTLYSQRLMRALDYLWRHLDQSVSLERLAEEACFSPYHFHRLFHALMGETLSQTRQRMLLHRAAGELAAGRRTLPVIASRAGFGSSAAFVRAFGKHYGETPGRYRQRRLLMSTTLQERVMHSVSIIVLPAMPVLQRHHRGPYMGIGQAFDALHALVGPMPAGGEPLQVFGQYLDDPDEVTAADLRSIASVSRPAGFRLSDDLLTAQGFVHGEIPAGRYACLEHVGPYAELKTAWDQLYRYWLPQSGEEPADLPCLEQYLNAPYNTSPTQLRSRLLLALQD
ncbi:AraC family transcriptional regulator [Aquitalea pelogenes]|uniref:AraC family transcriptional regulator n=1 Tax=Aquitalea pelogenes TaxID=1293573 RepID=UPI000788C589|nr:AraC family transcriptional regulator [Aquitalea pelogenes]